MKLYAFSDFHLSGDPPTKPMDIFGENWKNHREKILSAWKETITAGDTVIMAGDISWATHLEDALSDLKTLSALPGRKIIVRGNHDYWWNTVSKMKRMTDNAFEFIFNSALSVENIALAGTRGWIPETSKKITEEDKVIILREQGRLERSLIEAEKFNCEKNHHKIVYNICQKEIPALRDIEYQLYYYHANNDMPYQNFHMHISHYYHTLSSLTKIFLL